MATARSVVGRTDELAEVRRFLDALPGGRSALVLAGEPGIGKTTIWQRGVTWARDLGFTILSARPAEAERDLALSGLADLIGDILDEIADELPAPQRRALQVALLHHEADGPPLDHRTLGAAALSAVRALARTRPTLLALDNVQWLDEASARIIAYLTRRRGTEPVGLLVAVRSQPEVPAPLGLGAPPPEARTTLLRVGALDLTDLRTLLLGHAGLDLPRSTLLHIHGAAGGNPLFALEIARTLDGCGWDPVFGDPPPLPDSLRDLVGARIRALPTPVQEAMLHVALLAHPTVHSVRAALGAGSDELSALTTAEEAGVIEVSGERVRFSHPLLASAVCSAVSAERRQRAHGRLADVVSDVEQQARHLALARDAPDRRVADLLEQGAERARRRGSPATAAALWELAWRRTPVEDTHDADRRAAEAADCRFASGDTDRARRLLEATVAGMPPGPPRARVMGKLAEILFYDRGPAQASKLCRHALTEVTSERALRAELHLRLALFATHDAPTQYAASQAAADLLRRDDARAHPELLACALAVAAMHRFTNGRGIAGDDLRRARRLLPSGSSTHWAVGWARAALGAWATCFDPVEARSWFEVEHRRAVELGDEPGMGRTLMHLAEIDCWLGNWERARQEAGRAVEAIELTGQRRWLGFGLYARSLVQAHQGKADEAQQGAEEGLALALKADDPYVAVLHLQVLGFLGLSCGDPEEADRHLSRAAELVAAMRIMEPVRYTFHCDQIEIATALGHTSRARRLLRTMQARAVVAPRPWLVAAAARCEAVVRAAEGDLDGAETAAARALTAADGLPTPFERGRTLLVCGKLHRVQKRKRQARDALVRAGQVFDELGASLWSRQASAELTRCGLRRADTGALTPTEEKVAALVAAGLMNHEVAARMFISTKTVEANLTHIYRKLRVRNRRELARLTAGGRVG